MPLSSKAPLPQLVFMTTDAVGGVWSYSLELARGLAGHGVAIQLAVLGPEPDARQIAAADAVRYAGGEFLLRWSAARGDDHVDVVIAGFAVDGDLDV
jgi:hypothetical protein